MTAPATFASGVSLPVRRCPAEGGNLTVETSLTKNIPPTDTATLSSKTMEVTLNELAAYGQTQTPKMVEGLGVLADAFEAMTEGRLPPQLHLGSLDPGVGKTTLMRVFLRRLIRSPHQSGVSAMVCVSRLGEVRKLVEALSDDLHHVAAFTGDEDVNALTQTSPEEARVLITTQQMVEKRCVGHRRFAEVEDFHHQGTPRQVRIWDEAFLPGEVVSLSTDDLASLIEPVRSYCGDLADAIDTLRSQLSDKDQGDRLHVPQLEELGSPGGLAGLRTLARNNVENVRDNVRDAARDLIHVAGQTLPIHTARGVRLLLDYRDTMPRDLAPMVVLDASGRCRHTYALMEERGDLIRLAEVTKDYGKLSVHVWPRGGGRRSFLPDRDPDHERLKGIAQTIQSRPDEDWLVVHHKDRSDFRFKEDLRSYLSDDLHHRVHFLHWGNHHGTNDFAHVENVILAGTFFLPEHAYEGLTRLAAGMCDEEEVEENVLDAVKLGEHSHAILQALCRAAVRGMGSDGRCRPCRAYIIARKGSGIPQSLRDLFPGCSLRKWQPHPEKLKGNVNRAIDAIDHILCEWPDDIITYNELCELLRMDTSNFRKTVRKSDSFWYALRERGLEEAEDEVTKEKGLRLSPSRIWEPDDEDEEEDPDSDLDDWDF